MTEGRATRTGKKGDAACPFGSHRHRVVPVRHAPCTRSDRAATAREYDIVPTVEANGSKPISPLSVAAEPHCVSVKELQLGRRAFE